MPTPEEANCLARELGVTPQALFAIRVATFPRAKELLEELKKVARHNYHRLAKELHPDRTGGDPQKEERFKLLSQAMATIEHLQLQPVVYHSPIHISYRFTQNPTSRATPPNFRGGRGIFVVRMRP